MSGKSDFGSDAYDYLGGPVSTTVITSSTTVTLMVASAGQRLRIFKVFVDAPDDQPPVVFFKNG
jgi:hypothetical protein